MKSKKFSKKLTLNKKTVANLENNDMKEVQGGADTEVWCPTGYTYCVTGCITQCPRCTAVPTCVCPL